MKGVLAQIRRDRGLLVLLALLLLGLPLVTTRIFASDEVKYFAYLHSLAFDHDLDFSNDYQHWVNQGYTDIATLLKRNPVTGLPINEAPIGTALLWAPAFGLAHLGVLAARTLGAHVAADGYSRPYIAAVCYASYLYGWAGLLLIYGLLRRYFDAFAAVVAVVAAWIGTSALFYMVIAPPWSHAASLFAVSLFATVWLRTRPPRRRTPGQWAALGACAGLMMLIREQDALFLVLPAVETLFALGAGPAGRTRAALGRLARNWGLLFVAAVLVFTPQLVVYEVLGGRLGPSSTVSEKLNWLSPHALDVMASPGYGLLPWAPLVLLALIGLLPLARRDRVLGAACALAFTAQVYVAGSYSTWMGASSFGQRRFVNCTVLFAFGLAALLAWAAAHGVWRPALVGLTALCVAWEGGLVMQYALWHSAQRQAGLQWPAILGDQLGLVVRAPSLVVRYLFNRGSFMQRGGSG